MSTLTALLGYLVTLIIILALAGAWAAVWGLLWTVVKVCWWAGWIEREE